MAIKPRVRIVCRDLPSKSTDAARANRYLGEIGYVENLERLPNTDDGLYRATVRLVGSQNIIVLPSHYLECTHGSLWEFFWVTHPEFWLDDEICYGSDLSRARIIRWLSSYFPTGAMPEITGWSLPQYVSGDQSLETTRASVKIFGLYGERKRRFIAVVQIDFSVTDLVLCELTPMANDRAPVDLWPEQST